MLKVFTRLQLKFFQLFGIIVKNAMKGGIFDDR